MSGEEWFDDLPVLARMSPEAAADKLREVGEDDGVPGPGETDEDDAVSFGLFHGYWPARERPWQHSAHAFGYIAPGPAGGTTLPIRHAGAVPPDVSLRGARVKITLDRLRVAAYPGGGTHRILFDFAAQNQAAEGVEHLHFNAAYRVREGEHAAVLGDPIFVGLRVGPEGLAFRCYTVNVKNDQDEALLGFLDGDVFKAGLRLASGFQPALAPLSATAVGLTRAIAGRHRNVPVQDFSLGLDFSAVSTRARLSEGSYLAVQVPEADHAAWDWGRWAYRPDSGHVIDAGDPSRLLPYNYLVFGISRCEPEPA